MWMFFKFLTAEVDTRRLGLDGELITFFQLLDAFSGLCSFRVHWARIRNSWGISVGHHSSPGSRILSTTLFFSFWRKKACHWLTCDLKIPNIWRRHVHNTQAILQRGGFGVGTSHSLLKKKKKICFNWVKIFKEVARCQDSHNFHINKDSTTWNFSDCGSIWKCYREMGDYFLDWVHGGFASWQHVQRDLLV